MQEPIYSFPSKKTLHQSHGSKNIQVQKVGKSIEKQNLTVEKNYKRKK